MTDEGSVLSGMSRFSPLKAQVTLQKRDGKRVEAEVREECCEMLSSGHERAIAPMTSLLTWLPTQDQASKTSQHSSGSTDWASGFQKCKRRKRHQDEKSTRNGKYSGAWEWT